MNFRHSILKFQYCTLELSSHLLVAKCISRLESGCVVHMDASDLREFVIARSLEGNSQHTMQVGDLSLRG